MPSSPPDLSGHWTGLYHQQDRARRIRAEFLQQGTELSGRMWDETTEQVLTLAEFVALAGWPSHSDEQLLASLRAQVDAPPGTPVHYLTLLPEESQLSGRVFGDQVEFRKSYCGPHFTGFRVGTHLVGKRIPCHCVDYSGHIFHEGRAILGRWTIDSGEAECATRSGGEFELRR